MSKRASGKSSAPPPVRPVQPDGPTDYTWAFSSDIDENLRVHIRAMEVPLSHPAGEEFVVSAQVFDSGRAMMPVPVSTGCSNNKPPRYQNMPPGFNGACLPRRSHRARAALNRRDRPQATRRSTRRPWSSSSTRR